MVFQGPNGYSRKGNGPTAASLYYSFTRMATEGTLTVDGELMPVAGESWMDKEFGSNQLSADQTGWDWFSLQLDDRREVMLYDLRGTTAASAFGRGTVVEADGTTRYLTAGEFVVEEIDTWQSEATGARYPSGWRVRIPGADLSLIVTPELKAQENRSALLPRLFYWEGAVKVETCDGRAAGRGFVELTGYGTERVPAI
jgi:predicted secreted hydrolase